MSQEEVIENYPMSNTGFTSSNANHLTTGALKVRLDTKYIILGFKKYLRGQSLFIDDTDEYPETGSKQTTKERCNLEGQRALLQYREGLFNNIMVQANFSDEYYANLRYDFKIKLAEIFTINRIKWNMTIENRKLIMHQMEVMFFNFWTRCLYDREREVLTQTLRHSEQQVIADQKKGWRSWFK